MLSDSVLQLREHFIQIMKVGSKFIFDRRATLRITNGRIEAPKSVGVRTDLFYYPETPISRRPQSSLYLVEESLDNDTFGYLRSEVRQGYIVKIKI